jgi:hypothetical protein
MPSMILNPFLTIAESPMVDACSASLLYSWEWLGNRNETKN